MTGESLIKTVLSKARSQIQDELGGLLDASLRVAKPQIRRITKAEFFSGQGRSLALSRVAVDGDLQTEVAIFSRLKDAILLGGTLIMLPPSELAARMKKEAFGEEEADAFGEIANIITGILNSGFGAESTQKLRFRKVEVLPVIGDDLDPDSDDPFPPQEFILGAYPLVFEDEPLGDLEILFPVAIAGEQSSEPGAEGRDQGSESAEKQQAAGASKPAAGTDAAETSGEEEASAETPLVLIVADQNTDVESIAAVLKAENFAIRQLGLHDDLKGFLQTHSMGLQGVILVMGEISEQGFAAAIQVCSMPGEKLPLLAAGPRWTRSTVVQAARFGVADILVTPASPAIVREKVNKYFS
ncbi:MAG TPA: hypothetical protein VJ910_03085 [Desulfuromonadales bacterium]|nr:hypothetical protein [Desulfuromonadales bacterium]